MNQGCHPFWAFADRFVDHCLSSYYWPTSRLVGHTPCSASFREGLGHCTSLPLRLTRVAEQQVQAMTLQKLGIPHTPFAPPSARISAIDFPPERGSRWPSENVHKPGSSRKATSRHTGRRQSWTRVLLSTFISLKAEPSKCPACKLLWPNMRSWPTCMVHGDGDGSLETIPRSSTEWTKPMISSSASNNRMAILDPYAFCCTLNPARPRNVPHSSPPRPSKRLSCSCSVFSASATFTCLAGDLHRFPPKACPALFIVVKASAAFFTISSWRANCSRLRSQEHHLKDRGAELAIEGA